MKSPLLDKQPNAHESLVTFTSTAYDTQGKVIKHNIKTKSKHREIFTWETDYVFVFCPCIKCIANVHRIKPDKYNR